MKPKKNLNTEINDLLSKRWSPRSFDPQELNDSEITKLFEAIRWSPSAFNEQPWHFIYADRRDMAAFKNVHACLAEGNQSWTINSSLLIITFVKTLFERNGKSNAYATHDLGGAMANMTFQASDMDLYVHQMAGIQKDVILEKYNVPEGWEPLTMIAVGHLGLSDKLDDRLRKGEESEQIRHELNDIHSMNKW
jgi:nitroreductase